jgi:hypothetical protein
MEPEVQLVVDEANANRAFHETFCRSLTAPQLASVAEGSIWSAQDYIAHLATIDLYVNEWFEHLIAEKRWRPEGVDGAPFSIDVWNDDKVIPLRGAALEEVLGIAAENRALLWSTVDRFTKPVIERTFEFGGNRITLLRYLQLWAGHDPAHTVDMLRGIPERKSDPEVRAWIGKYRA